MLLYMTLNLSSIRTLCVLEEVSDRRQEGKGESLAVLTADVTCSPVRCFLMLKAETEISLLKQLSLLYQIIKEPSIGWLVTMLFLAVEWRTTTNT